MPSENFIIREIKPADNIEVSKIIRTVILEMGAPKVGTAYQDEATDQMFETYQKEKAVYYVLEHQGKVVGGAGIAQLDDFKDRTCELQKMYFLPLARGKGLGTKMITKCLETAKNFGYQNCYLETLPYMKDAVKFYKKNNFKRLEKPMGNTSHYSCDVWMIRNV